MADTSTTTDHDTIRAWTTKRQGYPAHVTETATDGEPGILEIGFQNPDGRLKELSWDEFFEAFEENKLAFLHAEEDDDGGLSRFCKFVSRD
ncbi:MAG: hypothetical protein AAGJ53_02505 [Pseudomonadota bacterium]